MVIINNGLAKGRLNLDYVLPDREIQKINQPTLWVWEEDDLFDAMDIGKRIHSGMVNSRFVGLKITDICFYHKLVGRGLWILWLSGERAFYGIIKAKKYASISPKR